MAIVQAPHKQSHFEYIFLHIAIVCKIVNVPVLLSLQFETLNITTVNENWQNQFIKYCSCNLCLTDTFVNLCQYLFNVKMTFID